MDYEISEQALEAVVLCALKGIEGVRALEAVPRSLADVFRRGRPVRLESTPEGLVVDLLLAVPYGVAIPELAARVQQEVDEALFLATGRRARRLTARAARSRRTAWSSSSVLTAARMRSVGAVWTCQYRYPSRLTRRRAWARRAVWPLRRG